uniref:Uncharacterized protein n=1 Tax=Glossina pallidipes TaxID=7398 RepID=A0A1A9Z5A3_GLOPL
MINDISGFEILLVNLRNELKKIFIEIDDLKLGMKSRFLSVQTTLRRILSVQVEKDLSQQQQPLVGWLERQLEKILNL